MNNSQFAGGGWVVKRGALLDLPRLIFGLAEQRADKRVTEQAGRKLVLGGGFPTHRFIERRFEMNVRGGEFLLVASTSAAYSTCTA